jgi:UDP-N-acetylmuramyl pentapeptide phosphotransferase/UDP-N-acetylglucosamine-1-phosphate transferase/glycosyltransferase involved in cell wall biosynthesis
MSELLQTNGFWLVASPVIGGVFGLIGVFIAMRLGVAWGIVDAPGPRKVHRRIVPRTGGIGIALATLVATTAVLLLAGIADGSGVQWIGLGVVLLLTLGVGVGDDLGNLPGSVKLLALILLGVALCSVGVRFDSIAFNPEGGNTASLGAAGWGLTIAWICGITVAIAFTDGLDGLAGGIGVIVGLTLAVVAMMSGQIDLALASLTLVGVLGGFLYFNGPWGRPGRVFMGDGGSMFLGVALASLPVMLNGREGVGSFRALVVPAAALGVPIIDTALTLVRRKVLQRRSLFAAEDGHVHHRLLAIGLSQPHAVFVLWSVTALSAGAAMLAAALGDGWMTIALLVPLLGIIWLFLFRTAGSVRGRETITMVRRHRASNRVDKQFRKRFEEAQLRLSKAADFGEWWRETTHAAEVLGFESLELEATKRDGQPKQIDWTRPETAEVPYASKRSESPVEPIEKVNVSLDVPQRRMGEGSEMRLRACVHVYPQNLIRTSDHDGSRDRADLESAGQRITYFNRLLSEHGLATLDNEDRVRLALAHRRRQAGPAIAADDDDVGEADAPAESPDDGRPSVAIVHDFLYTRGGAERVLEQMLEVFPNAKIFSVIDFVPEGERAWLRDKRATTTFIQRMPLARYKHRAYLPLMPLAIEQLDVRGFDIVLSSSYCVAKGVICRPDQLHVSYCHSPVRYAWDLQHEYLAESGLSRQEGRRRGPMKVLKSAISRSMLHYIRNWDARSANGVDVFLSNSDFVGRRIEKCYRRQSKTVYPPVDVSSFTSCSEKQDYYFTSSRMVPYKRMAMIAEAFTKTPERRLVIGGDGPDFEKVKRIAGPNVRVVGHQKHEEFVHYMQRARAFVFAAEEDFGIVPVEAMACGTPIIAYGRGGTMETVVDGVTGVHFQKQTPDSLLAAVDRFEQLESAGTFDATAISRHAAQFGESRFRDELQDVVMSHWSTRTGSIETPQTQASASGVSAQA